MATEEQLKQIIKEMIKDSVLPGGIVNMAIKDAAKEDYNNKEKGGFK